jgi:flagellum-specific peptidoglycan hydrolase FlgJ
MKSQFFKTNWFTIALLLLLLLTLVRKFMPASGGGATSPKQKERKEANPEKYTATESPALLGFSAESPDAARQQPAADKAAAVAFVRRFESVAVSERKKFGIPASVLLGCAFVNSTAGMSDAATKANNFFALPCDSDWDGEKATIDGRCLRRYESAWASFRDFSIYLSGQEWFGSAKKSAGKDWQKWAKELAKHSISDVPDFDKKLVQAIQAHRLYDLDEL